MQNQKSNLPQCLQEEDEQGRLRHYLLILKINQTQNTDKRKVFGLLYDFTFLPAQVLALALAAFQRG
jgi:hypothetical protein